MSQDHSPIDHAALKSEMAEYRRLAAKDGIDAARAHFARQESVLTRKAASSLSSFRAAAPGVLDEVSSIVERHVSGLTRVPRYTRAMLNWLLGVQVWKRCQHCSSWSLNDFCSKPCANRWGHGRGASIRDTFNSRYGGHPSQDPDIRSRMSSSQLKHSAERKAEILAKKEVTCLKNSGYRHPSQIPDVRRRQLAGCVRTKPTQLSNGEVINLQGYEPVIALKFDALGYTLEVPRHGIPYTEDGKSRYYFPDLIATRNGKYLVEVKSDYTLFGSGNGSYLEHNLRKFRAAKKWCRSRDMTFDLYVVSVNGRIHRIPSPTMTKLLKLQAKLSYPKRTYD